MIINLQPNDVIHLRYDGKEIIIRATNFSLVVNAKDPGDEGKSGVVWRHAVKANVVGGNQSYFHAPTEVETKSNLGDEPAKLISQNVRTHSVSKMKGTFKQIEKKSGGGKAPESWTRTTTPYIMGAGLIVVSNRKWPKLAEKETKLEKAQFVSKAPVKTEASASPNMDEIGWPKNPSVNPQDSLYEYYGGFVG